MFVARKKNIATPYKANLCEPRFSFFYHPSPLWFLGGIFLCKRERVSYLPGMYSRKGLVPVAVNSKGLKTF